MLFMLLMVFMLFMLLMLLNITTIMSIRSSYDFELINDTHLRICLEIIAKTEQLPEDQYVFIDASNLSKFQSLSVKSRIFSNELLIFIIHDKRPIS